MRLVVFYFIYWFISLFISILIEKKIDMWKNWIKDSSIWNCRLNEMKMNKSHIVSYKLAEQTSVFCAYGKKPHSHTALTAQFSHCRIFALIAGTMCLWLDSMLVLLWTYCYSNIQYVYIKIFTENELDVRHTVSFRLWIVLIYFKILKKTTHAADGTFQEDTLYFQS